MFLARIKVAGRLYAGFGLILAVLVAVTAVAMVKVDAINTALRSNNDQHMLVQRYAINFRGSVHDRSIAVRDVVLSSSEAERRQEVATIASLADFYAQSVAPLEALLARPDAATELRTLYTHIQDIERRTLTVTQAIIAEAQSGQSGRDALWNQAKPLYVEWLAAINRLIDFEEASIQAQNKAAMQEAGSFLTVMLTALVLALLLSGAIAWMVSRSILGQLGAEPSELAEVASRVAGGDLSPLIVKAGTHPDSVLVSLSAMQHSLARVVDQVRQAAGSLSGSATNITTDNAGLLRRTEEQAASLQQTAASMEEMTATVRNNADSAQLASQLATQTSAAAERGGAVVGEVVSTMGGIATSSQKIADIINVIDGIAFQTNILALNAAVEAARAGEQGRGFAVVAGEVRSLAQRSAQAAREIKVLIESSVAQVAAGSQRAGDAGATMTDIVTQVQRVADLIMEISTATTQQTEGISQVSDAIAHLDQFTQQNSTMVQHSASAAEGLQQQASYLAEVMSVFKLGREYPQSDDRRQPAPRRDAAQLSNARRVA